MQTAIITVGLGFGDEGKGATVDALCRRLGADVVIRYCGGSQAGHNVQLPDGRRHVFSQFGAGTFAGARTYLGPQMIVNPTALVREAARLRELGVNRPFELMKIHPRALVSTFFHQALNQLRELARGGARHGSCGHGIGETRGYWLRHGSDAIFAADLEDEPTLRSKLELLRQRMLIDLQEFVAHVPAPDLFAADPLDIDAGAVADRLLEIGERLRLDAQPPDCETAIFEGAQGVLLDEWHGFHPHTTWSTVTPRHALELAQQCKAADVRVWGITRCFTTRHGAGPLPTHDPALTERLADLGNPWNRWQGDLRVGWLDLPLLRYAAQAIGPLDGLAVTCLDQCDTAAGLDADGDGLPVCEAYEDGADIGPPGPPRLAVQEQRNELLKRARPVYRRIGRSELLELLGETIAPIQLEAYGPTHLDRIAPLAARSSRRE